ncbi:DNA-binding transcriptional regulator, LysR family [Cognatiyoonia koreensis]|uniref:DNA-binding transcriptional regulator, LysR family n=1 Tax=Cognatiyoonia koreensis TaxID=364200 RepID=A0A1I0PU68_9RHOB|nr:LysR family transcriptional regulator [Cognatiyoonia koreensis]SEW17955.1 DNA-binding transcriptional regulator, LysR family [Cognatiyoonia koreensis]
MKLSDIDLRLLRVFQAVAEAGGFGKAQGVLGISQPAISAQIAKLEDRLGLRLCDRGPKGFALTGAGEQVLEEVTTLLDQIDAAAARLNAIGVPATQQIRIGVVDSTVTDPNNPLIGVLRELRADMPDLKINIGIFDFLACLEELRAHRLDIAIVGIAGNERIPNEAEAFPLYREVSSLYCSPDHACAGMSDPEILKSTLAASEISAHSFVFNPIDDDLEPMLLDHSEGVAQDTIELTAYLALSGSHVGLLPDHYAAPWVKDGQLVALAPLNDVIVSDFHALRLQSDANDPTVDRVWQVLKSLAI